MKLWQFLKNNMCKNAGQRVSEGAAQMTFEELIIFAESFSKNLKDMKCCAILCHSEMAAAMALLACFAAGVTAVPLSYRYGALHCKKIIDTIGPDAVITDEDGKFMITKVTDATYKNPDKHPALIMCTSGTTGMPKGAMLSEDNIIANVTDIADYFAIAPMDTLLIARPIYHCAVLTGEFLTALIKGTGIRFYSGRFQPAAVLKLIREYRITAFCSTPTLLHMMARFQRENTTLRHICISGECMDLETGRRIAAAFKSAAIYHIYGLTEACPRVSYLPPKAFFDYADCVGVPLRSVSVKILDAAKNEVLKGRPGILWVKGKNVMLGYYNDPQKTAEVLKDGWLCTNDVAVINEAGFIKIKGRNDNLIIKAGMNIYPQEIEGALKSDPRVREVLVCGAHDKKIGTQILLTVAGDFKNTDEVRTLCKARLPECQLPSKIRLVDEIPKNGSGKIIRRVPQ